MSLAALGTAYLRLAIRYGEWVPGTSILVAIVRKAGYSRRLSAIFTKARDWISHPCRLPAAVKANSHEILIGLPISYARQEYLIFEKKFQIIYSTYTKVVSSGIFHSSGLSS